MSTNTLLTQVKGFIKSVLHIDSIVNALTSEFVGRGSDGVPTAGQDLGTANIPWGSGYFGSLFLNGLLVSTSDITVSANQITSGKVRSDSNQPDFLRSSGVSNSVTIEGGTTPLSLIIQNTVVTVSSDLLEPGLIVAPSTNNTCLINDLTLSGGLDTKYQGEGSTILKIGTVGTEISDRVGFIVALKTSTSEIMYGLLDTSTTLSKMFRGYFFDSSGDPIVRETITHADTLTLMELGWVFVQNNGTTIDVSYVTPIIDSIEPPLGLDGNELVTGQYWLDTVSSIWKRYSGSSFVDLERTLIGVVVMDGANCIATRSFDFTKSYKKDNNSELSQKSVTIISNNFESVNISAYGRDVVLKYSPVEFDTATDFESGVSEAPNTLYYLYVSDIGENKISDEKWYRRDDLKGRYHPYHSWRAIGEVNNNNSSDFEHPGSYGELLAENIIKQTIIEIGPWDMDTVDFLNISLPNDILHTNVAGISVIIRNDIGSIHFDFASHGVDSAWTLSGIVGLALGRVAAGGYDNVGFSSTSINRGLIYITHRI